MSPITSINKPLFRPVALLLSPLIVARRLLDNLVNFRSFGTIVLIALPVLAIIGVLAPMALGMESLSLLSIYLVVPMILASFVYWKYFRDI